MKHKAILLCLFTMAVLALVATLGAQARSEVDSPFREGRGPTIAYRPAVPPDGCRLYGMQVAEQILEFCHTYLPPGGGPTSPNASGTFDAFDTVTAMEGGTLRDVLTALEDRFGRAYRQVMSEQQELANAIYSLRDLERLKSTLPGYFTAEPQQPAGRDAAAGENGAPWETTDPPGDSSGDSAYRKIEVPEVITWAGSETRPRGQPVVATPAWSEFEVTRIASDSVLVREAPAAVPLR